MSKTVIITGSARRIGAAIAKQLHKEGFRIMLHANKSQDEALALCNSFNKLRAQSAAICFADLLVEETPEILITKTIDWSGRLDCLIHNASLFIADKYVLERQIWRSLFTVNVEAPFNLSLKAKPFLSQHQGSIIYITDIHAHSALDGYSVYCQTKAALTMQMLSFAKMFAPYIRVNAIAPGSIIWPEGDNKLSQDIKKSIMQKTLLQKHGNPESIAKAALFFIQNDYITGQTLNIDGGRLS